MFSRFFFLACANWQDFAKSLIFMLFHYNCNVEKSGKISVKMHVPLPFTTNSWYFYNLYKSNLSYYERNINVLKFLKNNLEFFFFRDIPYINFRQKTVKKHCFFLICSRGGRGKNEKYTRFNANNEFRKIMIYNSFLRL